MITREPTSAAFATDGAQCVPLTLRNMKRLAARVVEGTVLDASDVTSRRRVVTIDVHRVSKGPLERTMVVYVEPTLENPCYPSPGERSIFFALPEFTIKGRPKAPSPVLFLSCGSVWPTTRDVTSHLGRSKPIPAPDPQGSAF